VAVNLQGVEKDELRRGDVVTAPPGRLAPTGALDVHLRLLADAPPVKTRSLVHLHIGTADTVARVVLYDTELLKPGREAYAQLRLQAPVVALSGDRFVIRRFSPLATIGGGQVLDPAPRRRRRSEGIEDLQRLKTGDLQTALETRIRHGGAAGIARDRLEGWIAQDIPAIRRAVEELLRSRRVLAVEDHLVHSEALPAFRGRVLSVLKAFHRREPMKPGMSKEELRGAFPGLPPRIFAGLLSRVREAVVERDIVRSAGFRVSLSAAQETGKKDLLERIRRGGIQPPFVKDLAAELGIPDRTLRELLRVLEKEGEVRRINENLCLGREAYDEVIERLRGFFAAKPEMTVAEFRDLLKTTRKYALPLLEHLDTARVTLRKGDVRRFLLKEPA